MDGWITIGSKLDNKQLEQDIKSQERRLQQYEKEAERLTTQKSKLELDTSQAKSKLDYLDGQLDVVQQKLKIANQHVADAGTMKSRLSAEAEVSRLSAQEAKLINQSDMLGQKYESQLRTLDGINQKMQQNARSQANVRTEVEKTNQKLQGTKINTSQINSATSNVGNAVRDVTRRVGTWALAVIGVRSAYMFVRQAMSTLTQYNDKMAANVEYLRYAIATALQPVIERILQLIYKLMFYINYLAKAWFGINLFAKASAKSFESATAKPAKNLKKAKKEAKELQKTLAGFDEMNVLNDNTKDKDNSDKDNTGTPGMVPSFDLSKMEGDVPKWLQWIAKHGPTIISILLGIVGALLALKLGFSGIQALGIGLAIAGIVYAIQAFLKYLKDPSLQNLGKIFIGIGVAIVGVGIAIGSLPVVIAGVVVLIFGIIVKYWDKIKAFLQSGIDWLTGKSDWVHKIFGDSIGAIYDTFVSYLQSVLDWFDNLITNVKRAFDAIIKIVKAVFSGDWATAWEGVKELASAVWDFIKATFQLLLDTLVLLLTAVINTITGIIKWVLGLIVTFFNTFLIQPIVKLFTTLWNLIKTGATALWNGIKSLVSGVASWVNTKIVQPISKFFTNLWNGIKNGVSGAVSKVKSLFNGVVTFFSSIITKIVNTFKNIGTKVGNAVGSAFKKAINVVLKAVESILNTPIRAINGLLSVINAIPGVYVGTLPTFSLPRLAKGGIINMPGRGIPIGGAIGGEGGPEGVIPLTDSQQMALLGEAIGKYISLNANIPVYVGNRLVAREIRKIDAEDDFAYNS